MNIKRLFSILIFSSFVAVASAQVPLKVAVVDMTRVLKEYYKTQEAETRLKEVANGYQKDLKDRQEAYSKLVDQIRTLQEEAKDASLSEAKKKEKMDALQEKVKDAQIRERENMNFMQTASKLMQEQRNRSSQGILEEVEKVVTNISKAQNYDLVFVKGEFPSPVLYSRVTDLSQEIITELNKGQGKGAAPAKK